MKKTFFTFLLFIFSCVAYCQSEFAMAENYYRNNEFEKAIQIYEKLVDKSPYNTTYLGKLVAANQELNRFYTVDSLLRSKLKKSPRLGFLNIMLGYNFDRQQQTKKANQYYQKGIQSIHKNPAYASTIANLLKNYSKLDLAILAYDIAIEKKPNSNYDFYKAQIYGEKGDFDKMFSSYVDLVDKRATYLKTVKRYTAKYITDDAENEINIAFKKALLRKSASNPKPEWNTLLSWLFIQQKQYNKALIQQKALFARTESSFSGIENLGTIAFNNKDYEVAKECFDFIVEKTNNPEDKFNAILMNLQIAIATKQPNIEEQFTSVLAEYGTNRNTLPIQVAYADFLTFTENNPQKAKEVLEKATKFARSKFEKAHIKLKLADVLVYTGKFNKALIYFSQIQIKLKNHPLAQQARFKVAQVSYFKGDFDWAKAQLKVLKGSASQLIANDAVDLFVTISDNQPRDSIPTGLKELAKADVLAFQNKNLEAVTVLDTILSKYASQPIEDEALFKQAKLYVKLNQLENAITNFEKVVAIKDNEGIFIDDSLYQLAELYNNKLNKPEKAQEYYQKIIFDHPSSIYLVDARKKYRKLRGDDI